jgi:hypothetical protein
MKRSVPSRLSAGLLVWLLAFPVAQADVTTNTWSYTGSWTNPAANWTNIANWSASHTPLAGEAVVINGTVTLTNSTEVLYSYTLNANKTNMFYGTNTILVATDVTIYGVISHGTNSAGTTNSSGQWIADNGVWIQCTNLMLASSAKINLRGKGYQQVGTIGSGPGGGGARDGGGYGGAGGMGSDGSLVGGLTYGVSNAPTDPGSAAGVGQAGGGGAGGGMVRIDASGDVTIDGTIDADGLVGTTLNGNGGGGSGGSVFINCRRFAGVGSIHAIGGDGTYTAGGGGGGGGRMAVICDTNAQLTVTTPPMVNFSVAGGPGWNRNNGGRGTLYLSSMGLLSRGTLTGAFRLIVPDERQWTWTNNFVCTNCEILFPDGLRLTVTNDLILAGTNAVLTLTNVALTVGRDISVTGTTSALWIYCDTNTINVGRNLTSDKGGKVYIMAGMSNGLPPYYAALVSVTNGDVTIGANACVYSGSHGTNGGSPKFSMQNLSIAAGGTFSAKGYGFAGGDAGHTSGYGPAGAGLRAGGGYGGGGGAGNGAGGATGTYGAPEAPIIPGSGSGLGQIAVSAAGGGVVWIEATNGDVTVDGTIDADGLSMNGAAGNNIGGGAGGSVFISCRRFLGAGSIHANGGSGLPFNNYGGGGGGGRIAVICDTNAQSTVPTPPTIQYSIAGGPGQQYGGRGTLYLASLDLFSALFSQQTLTGGYQLLVPSLSAWSWTNNLICTNCDILLPAGIQLTVSNDLSLASSNSILILTNVGLTVGRDLSVTGTSSKLWLYSGTNTLCVGRNMNAYKDGTLWFSGTNVILVAADVNINGGVITHGGNTATTTNSSGQWVADRGVWLQCANLTIATNGSINVKGMGYQVAMNGGYGPGGGGDETIPGNHGPGGGHAGPGGNSDTPGAGGVGGGTYGVSNAPITPGSAGSYGQGAGGAGGGMVRIEVLNGNVTIDGTIDASGVNGSANHGGGGAGGSVFIRARRFQGTGTISAKGGDAPSASNLAGAGGGGRIAVWRIYDSWTGTPTPANNGTAIAAGTNTLAPARSGGKGTICWGWLPMSGTVLSLR